jgi:hypothetical protein
MPSRDDREFTHYKRGAHNEYARTADAAEKAWEQVTRQRWRALALVIKAKLEAVTSGISTFEAEFLANTMLPDGRTVGDVVTAWFMWPLYLVYALGFLMTWRTAAYVIYADVAGMDALDAVAGIVFGAAFALAWPVVAPCYIAYKHDAVSATPLMLRFLRVPAAERRKQEQLELKGKAAAQARRIDELERELFFR